MDTTYCYDTLAGTARKFRLATVDPGTTSNIHLDISVHDLSAGKEKAYEALSYTWGDAKDKVKVLVGDEQRSLGVTQNLREALSALAAESTEQRVFWIDAICINQGDLDERSHQVKLMTEIYKNAYRVVAWLGLGSQGCFRAMESIECFADSIDFDWSMFQIKSRSSKPWAQLANEMLDKPDAIRDLEELLSRPWFERLWIWQEIRVASQRAVVKCGGKEIAWEDFHKAIFALRLTSHPQFSKEMKRRMAVIVQMKNMASSTTLVALTSWTRKAKCGDQRDRIYAVQGMIQEREAALVEPNYTISDDRLFLEVAKRYITELKSLELLTCCRFDIRRPSLPSWVPNWSRENDRKFAQIMNPDASGRSACEATVVQDRVLHLQGKQCCTVKATFKLWDVGATETDAISSIRHIAGQIGTAATYLDGTSNAETLAVILELGSVAENFEPIPVDHLLQVPQAEAFVRQILAEDSPERLLQQPELKKYISALAYKLEGWCFFETQEGLLGVSPADLRSGDTIATLLGARSLMVLRGPRGGRHQVLAECYVRGLMHAEGLLGLVPQGYRRVARLDRKTNAYHACWRRQSGDEISFQTTDPRLGILPPGWRLKQHENQAIFNYYENPTTGEGMNDDLESDPRLGAQELLKKGVSIRNFELS